MGIDMNNKKKYLWSVLFLLVLVVVTFVWFFLEYDFMESMEIVELVELSFIIGAVLLNLLFFLCEAYNLHELLKSLDCRVPFRKCIKYVFVECYFCAITPSASGGQPAQLIYMKDDGIPLSKSTISLLMIAITYKSSLLIYALCLYLLSKEHFISSMGSLKILFYLGIVMNIGAILFMVLALFSEKLIRKVASYFLLVLGKLHMIKDVQKYEQKIHHTMDGYREGAQYIAKNKGLFVRIMVITMIQRTCRFIVPFFIYLDLHIINYSLFKIFMIQSIVSISEYMLPLPGAFGVSETCYMLLFKKVFTGNLLMPSLVLCRGVSFYGMVLVSSFFIIAAQIRRMNRKVKLGRQGN
jgi:uncharacterized protein (TIRG00374 family)